MFKRILIANRGEIAVRIIRACHEMGIETVAIYSTADKDQLHVKLADYAVCVGKPRSSDSYLNVNNIISTAISLDCDAIHPGYGFLSENADFAKLVEAYNMKFIGPSGDVISLMGDKAKARELMMENNVPTVPGSEGVIESAEEAIKICDEIGFPVLIKAAAGGGGRGMRRVFSIEDLEKEFTNAKTEAINCFGNGDMYIEKLVIDPKHIEFQIIADSFGNVIHLGERDCSIQRRNQKMIEEAPSVFLDDETRNKMGEVAVRAAKVCNYENAGTIEFVVDENKNFYFIEMNTRIQVEHPVTEMVTGFDLIKEQLRVAAGLHLSKKQEDIKIEGYAIECRVNAENPFEDFRPYAGKVDFFYSPGGMDTRFDSFLYNDCSVSPFYDSMIGKIIVKGETRLEAIRKMRRAIEETFIDGIKTNLGFQYTILHDKDFIKGNFNTSYLGSKMDSLLEQMKLVEEKDER
ncbi:acetyl-CoA carboxylase biotin carboxylase subunit [Miniphocaeibacter massiliensis]|uniref:acetyl-CoA carboxylase biotin carboxylase subunit n=1 Tax=Miniphocaeibacter massiliensis TaxID=2041841 RepID=UPI000C1C5D97|nr:acetyl-CoA carboxylase biotin carboxylase subunit [Miniphocaeibacter massiliensis]